MLRRRRRSMPRERIAGPGVKTLPGETPPVVKPAPGSRRRPRPGVQVPNRLIIDASVRETEEILETAPRAAKRPRKTSAVVLVTGFDAFGGETMNPSWEICERLPRDIAGLRVEKCRVPCEFRRAIDTVGAAIDRLHPDLVICIGQAGGRAHLSVERVAINVDDARIEDNGGQRPIDEAIVRDGPPAYFATLPIKAMVEAMRAVGVPAEISNSAGTYVCNHLMYGVLHHLAGKAGVRAGFVHVPYCEAQVLDKPGVAAMALDTMVKGIEAAIGAAHRHAADVKIGGGTLD